ncbi:MAG TPA: hypothetical protein DD827_01715 [Gammaproteobacteria bacterium]|jgi:predicted ATP-grasp superfamily ATP-dependent carboligase|nr:hypothetical protein [Gammaproteobacteria bacterium]
MTKQTGALVTYGWNRVAYNVVRSLAKNNVKVAVGDVSKLAMSRFSRYSESSFKYPSFYQDPAGFIESLIKQQDKHRKSVYLPVHEETFIASRYRSMLEKSGITVPVSSIEILKKLHKKDRLHDTCQNLGLPTPAIVKIESLNNIKSLLADMDYPLVVKDSQTNSAKGVHYIQSEKNAFQELTEIYNASKFSPFLQQYVEGEGYGVSLLMNHGEPRAVFTHKRLREKTHTGGTSTLRVSTKVPLLEEYAIELLSGLNYHGVAMVEFKYNEKTGQAYIIDVNPRFWGSLSLAIQSGVDFPYLLYKMAVDGDVPAVVSYKEGVKVKWLLGDVLTLFSEIKHTGKFIAPLRSYVSSNSDGFDDLYYDDPLPFIFQSAYYLKKFLTTMSVNPTQDALLDIDTV